MYINKEKQIIKKYIKNNYYFYNVKTNSFRIEKKYISFNKIHWYIKNKLEYEKRCFNFNYIRYGNINWYTRKNLKNKIKECIKIFKKKKYIQKKIIELFKQIKKIIDFLKKKYILDFIYIKIYNYHNIFYANILFSLKSLTGLNLINIFEKENNSFLDFNSGYSNIYLKNLYKTKQILNFFKKQNSRSLFLKIMNINKKNELYNFKNIKKISTQTIINIWKIYMQINNLYCNNNKLFKKDKDNNIIYYNNILYLKKNIISIYFNIKNNIKYNYLLYSFDLNMMIKINEMYLKKAYNLIKKNNSILNNYYKKKNKLNIKKYLKKKNKLNIKKYFKKKNKLSIKKYFKKKNKLSIKKYSKRLIKYLNNNDETERIKYLKQKIEFFKQNNYLFFQIKINFKNKKLNKEKKIELLNKYIEKINKKIKLLEFIYINKNIKNNNSYAILIIGIKSIIGYNKILFKNYKKIFKKNRNILIQYLPKNNKSEKIINKIIKNSKTNLFICKPEIYKDVYIYDIYKDNVYKENYNYVFLTYNYKERIKIKIKYFNKYYLIPDIWYNYNKKKNKKYLKKYSYNKYCNIYDRGKLDKEFNSFNIRSVDKISILSIINIWITYCIINDIYYSEKDNKLYKRKIKEENYTDYEDKYEGSDIIDKIIKIKVNNKIIIIHNSIQLISKMHHFQYGFEYEYFGELNYFINKINFIMNFMIKCYPQQINKSLTKKLISKYSKNAFKIIKEIMKEKMNISIYFED
jgi:hypothetical protein